MKLFKYLFIVPVTLFLSTAFVGCSKEVGLRTPPSFENTNLVFNSAAKDTILLASNDVDWFFADLYVNHKMLAFSEVKSYTKDIPKKADNKLDFVYKFENDWFSIEKLDNRKIRVLLKENQGELSRAMSFVASVGNATKKIDIVQKPK